MNINEYALSKMSHGIIQIVYPFLFIEYSGVLSKDGSLMIVSKNEKKIVGYIGAVKNFPNIYSKYFLRMPVNKNCYKMIK